MVEVFRRSKRDLFALVFISAPYILNYAFFAHRQGGSPQGRILTPLSWIGIIMIAYFIVYNRKKIYSGLFWISSLVSLIIPVLLLQNPSYLYQPTTHEYTFRGSELFISLSNLHFYLPGILPSFLKINNLGYIPNYVWIGIILLFTLGYTFKNNLRLSKRLSFKAILVMAGLIGLFFWFSFYPGLSLVLPVRANYSPAKSLGFYKLDQYAKMVNPGEFHLTKNFHDYRFQFTSWHPIKELKLEFGASEGVYNIEIKLFDRNVFKGKTSNEVKSISVPSPPQYRYKKANLYPLSVKLEQVSGVPITKKSYFFSIYPEI
jgi:hypothetical protein